jgi:hypothetical protein
LPVGLAASGEQLRRLPITARAEHGVWSDTIESASAGGFAALRPKSVLKLALKGWRSSPTNA